MKKILIALLLYSHYSFAYENYIESASSFKSGGVDGIGNYPYLFFNNPSSLAEKPKLRFFSQINGQISKETYDLILNIPKPEEGTLNESLSKHFGNKYNANANGIISVQYNSLFITPFYSKIRSFAELNYRVYPEAKGYISKDRGFSIAFGHRLGTINLGFSSFFFKRHYDIYEVDLITALNKTYEYSDEESFISHNLSASYDLNTYGKFLLNYKNFNNPNSKSKYFSVNQDLTPTLNASYQYVDNNWTTELNVIDINNYYNAILTNKIRIGFSYNWNWFLFNNLGFGIMDKGLSFGFDGDIGILDYSFATYEKNLYNFYDKKNRFYSLNIGISF